MPPWNTGAGHGEDMPRKGIDGRTRIILSWQSQVSAWLSASGEDGFGRSPILEFRVAVRLPFAKGKEDPERSGLEFVNTSTGIGDQKRANLSHMSKKASKINAFVDFVCTGIPGCLYWYTGMYVLFISVQKYLC